MRPCATCFDILFRVCPVSYCDHFIEEEGACCLAFLWFVECVLTVLVCLIFLLMPLVDYFENTPIQIY